MAQIEKQESNNDEFSREEEQDDIINNFKNFYDLNPGNIKINKPYNFNLAIDILNKLTLEDFTKNLNEIVQKEINLDFLSNKNISNFSLNNILFLTTKSCNNISEYIILNDFIAEKYIKINKSEISKNAI